MLILMTAARLKLLQSITSAAPGPAGPLNGCEMMLFTNPVDIDPEMSLTDLTECAFGGYARSSVLVFADYWTDSTHNPTVTADAKQFLMTDSVKPEVIHGYALVLPGTPDTLVAAEPFEDPVGLNFPGQGLEVVVVLALTSAQVGRCDVTS